MYLKKISCTKRETGIKVKQDLTSGKVYYLGVPFLEKNPDFFKSLKLIFY